MNEMEHKLILDYRNGTLQARCSCGEWKKSTVTIRVQNLPDVYDRIEDEHCNHVEEVESQEASLA
jgi:hypothetical protein